MPPCKATPIASNPVTAGSYRWGGGAVLTKESWEQGALASQASKLAPLLQSPVSMANYNIRRRSLMYNPSLLITVTTPSAMSIPDFMAVPRFG